MSSKSSSHTFKTSRRVIRMKQLREKIPFSESHFYALISKGQFPKPFQVAGGRAAFWYEEQVDMWLDEQRASNEGTKC